jgi:hypothetical protein
VRRYSPQFGSAHPYWVLKQTYWSDGAEHEYAENSPAGSGYWWCCMMRSHLSQINSHHVMRTPTLGAILLVEADLILRESRALLLSTLNLPVLKASSYCDTCRLPDSASISLAAISLLPCESEAQKVAAYVRRQWCSARILLLGTPKVEFDDPLYDEIVCPGFNPSGLLEASRRLLSSFGANFSPQNESK